MSLNKISVEQKKILLEWDLDLQINMLLLYQLSYGVAQCCLPINFVNIYVRGYQSEAIQLVTAVLTQFTY